MFDFLILGFGSLRFYGSAEFSTHNANSNRNRELTIPHRNQNNHNSPGSVVNIKTFYVARNIDVMKVHSVLYGTKYQHFDKKSVTITIDESLNQYISIFDYGSCVFFNIPAGEFCTQFSCPPQILNID